MSAKEYTMTIAGVKASLPLCPINETTQIGAFVIFGKPELTVASAAALLAKAPEYDVIITAESKGIPLAYEMARQHGDKTYIVARKKAKFYMRNVVTFNVQSITTAGMQTLCLDGDDVSYMEGKRVLVVDDVISTGESLHALESLVNEAGGKIVGKMAVLAEGEAAGRDDILFLEKLPLFDMDGNPLA